MDIGNRIRQLREAKGWTTNRLANQCGISQSFLRSVELNEKGISVENLALVCTTLGISMKAFFDLPGEGNGEDERLLRRIERLNPEQRKALASFLESLLQ